MLTGKMNINTSIEVKVLWSDHLLRFCFILHYKYTCESVYGTTNPSASGLSHKMPESPGAGVV